MGIGKIGRTIHTIIKFVGIVRRKISMVNKCIITVGNELTQLVDKWAQSIEGV
jgi:hypothetical protein